MPKGTRDPADIRAPGWLSRGQKVEFLAVIAAQKGTEVEISGTQADLIADLIATRGRIAVLHHALDATLSTAKAQDMAPDPNAIATIVDKINACSDIARMIASQLRIWPAGDRR